MPLPAKLDQSGSPLPKQHNNERAFATGAEEAKRAGLAARVVSAENLLPEALETAQTIASYGKTAAMFACEAVNRAEQSTLHEGILYERRTYRTVGNS